MPRLSFREACSRYVHRYTMDHVPMWALERPCDHGGTTTQYYAPQYRSDREWYEKTIFPGEASHPFPSLSKRGYCYTTGQTWPLGQWLDAPFRKRAA